MRCAGAVLLTLCVLGAASSSALAVGPPIAGKLWASQVDSRSATLSAEVDPNGSLTTGYMEYATNPAFTGAKRVNVNVIGSEAGMFTVNFPTITSLTPDTTYYYRVVLTSGKGQTVKPTAAPYPFFRTAQAAGGPLLSDGRGWEMVSPVDKNGGGVATPESIAEGGALQAAAQGGSATYSSASSFAGGQGAPPASQYVSTRTSSGWTAQNITVPIFSASYDIDSGGAPYRLFSTDLARGLLLNGKGCRGEATGCPVPNPTLPGTGAPAGFQNYYLRTTSSGSFEALLGPAETGLSGQSASQFEAALAGATPDLAHVVLSSCAKLTASATSGCPGQDNLYEFSGGTLKQLNASPGATLVAQGANAISTDGTRVYFDEGGNLFVRDGSTLKQADQGAGGGGSFQLASGDGALAYFTKGGDLYRYGTTPNTATKLTSSADVVGALGAATNGSNLYYLRTGGLYRCTAANAAAASGCDGAVKIADTADASDYPPASGTARVSADGTKLLFASTTPLEDHAGNTYDNTDLVTGEPDTELYLYDAATGVACISCNPTNGRPIGFSSIPGAVKNGAGLSAYEPRVLADNGRRIFFTSADALVPTDTNTQGSSNKGVADAYQWEAQGEGSCTRPEGCVSLLSSGRDATPSLFADASEDGSDAFFLTGASLVGADPGAIDLYDARVGGGFAEPGEGIPCEGDSCQALPPEPTEPTLTTLLSGPGNPPVHYTRYGFKAAKSCPKGKVPKTVKTKGGKKVKKCVAKRAKRPHRRSKGAGR
ncbi:MAG TPA: fibronectin type III domain-containing protein [Solirubrobacterales bacterium]|nr:fibronectin type III domain-containing protein [Solirubrobacterales bacterium]